MEELIDIYTEDRVNTGVSIPREGAFLKEGQFMLYVLAILENQEGKILITQRSLDKHWAAGWWEVTGGGVLSGETPHDAVTREVGEETGLDVSAQDISPVYSYKNVDLARGDNYIVDIYHFHLDFTRDDVSLQKEEAVDCMLATWDDICVIHNRGEFLHFSRLQQALSAEGIL